jgi:hypothetical protein
VNQDRFFHLDDHQLEQVKRVAAKLRPSARTNFLRQLALGPYDAETLNAKISLMLARLKERSDA